MDKDGHITIDELAADNATMGTIGVQLKKWSVDSGIASHQEF